MSEPDDILHDLLWTEVHRPTKLADLALGQENRAVLAAYLAAGEIPHLLLVGPSGTGKTTVGRILFRSLDCRHLVLNASNERGIETVRSKIGTFVTAMNAEQWQIVFLDEADAMTSDAQTALRNLIETYADRARFILTANRIHKIIGPIQSRCQILTFSPPPFKERYRILANVLKAEGIEAEPQIILSYAERYTDLRHMLMETQRAYLANAGTLPLAQTKLSKDGQAVLDLVTTKNWTGLRHLTKSEEFDVTEGLRQLFWAIPDDHPQAGFLRHVVGRGVHESGFTPDPVILFLGVAAEAMEGM